ncbi:hypothetical protein TTHERM_00819440 (macronuclear) [Tetrahymena thermophila SB210]|uniref:Uncharacterized protein n=1 Tax=Tetrahymena thermophila (strain SB210) TaxID=312017 RepID=Q23HA1_TETTS|nr:hypothetical protein TTHERM_00819440 [Tetrahymena thermophila SB210]EAR95907.2 hypothetical protein TTHERM_00819440 [Tetrahymena thermophila SB210]|eukprot:XP_001016152.2 hypothetical protein TTHERM_00819440 [Tetrahymena thermophila SB210]
MCGVNGVNKDFKLDQIQQFFGIFNSLETILFQTNKNFYRSLQQYKKNITFRIDNSLVIVVESIENQNTQTSILLDTYNYCNLKSQYYHKIEEIQNYMQNYICQASMCLQSNRQKYGNNFLYQNLQDYIYKFSEFAFIYRIPKLKIHVQKHVGSLDEIGSLCQSEIIC